MFKMSTAGGLGSADWYTSLQLLVEVFHCSVINGFLRKANQVSYSASFNSKIVLALAAANSKTPALVRWFVIIQWIEIELIGGTYPWWWSAAVRLLPVLCDACQQRRLAGIWNHSVATIENITPVLATVFPGNDAIIFAFSFAKYRCPNAHFGRHCDIRGKLLTFNFNQQSMRFIISFRPTSTSSDTQQFWLQMGMW